jgi:endonuclease YncB( thermonuclease family)
MKPTFQYKCVMTRVLDGDTMEFFVDLGFDSWIKSKFRIAHVDTPELKTPQGKQVKSVVESWFSLAGELTLNSLGMDKYGRWLAEVYSAKYGQTLNSWLLDNSYATPYEGGRKVSS